MRALIDLRSDTVTRPTPGMRKAMAEADVGDDVFGEDPTVNRLQERMAAILEKEASLFVPSGTMANQLAIKAHTQPGDEVIIEGTSHSYSFEGGGGAALSGVQFACIKGDRGILSPSQVEEVIRPADHHFAVTRLICLENTHNRGGGTVFPFEKMAAIRRVAGDRGLSIHLDGARLWNACTATGLAPGRYASLVDSVSVCLSKGLGAPIGSVIAGTRSFVDRAHRFRKMFGGGMRQAGILAAAGLYALDHHLERLAEDHENAKHLAQGLAEIKGVALSLGQVETNIFFFDIAGTGRTVAWLAEEMKKEGILIYGFGPSFVRIVTHLDIRSGDVGVALKAFRKALA